MLAHGIECDVFFQDHFVIFYFKLFGEVLICFLIQTTIDFHAHTCDAVRGIFQSFTFCIFTDSFKEKSDCLFYFLFVYHKKTTSYYNDIVYRGDCLLFVNVFVK